MSKQKQRNHTAEFKAKVALDALRGDLTINEISKNLVLTALALRYGTWGQPPLFGLAR